VCEATSVSNTAIIKNAEKDDDDDDDDRKDEEKKEEEKRKKRIGLAGRIFASFAFLRVARQGRVWMCMASHRVLLLQHPIEQIVVFVKVMKARTMAMIRHETKT
jgi:hypothetical protein